MSTQTLFVLSNILGGLAVLGGYYWGITSFSEYREALWGGVHGALRTILTVSMLFSALGYLLFCYVSLFRDGLVNFNEVSNLGSYTVVMLVAIFLTSAALWMPSTIYYLKTQNSIWWIVSVASLWVTALALLALLYISASADIDSIGVVTKYLAIAGLASITFHCLVFDAVIWVILFHK